MDSIESIDPQFRLDAEVAPVYKCTNYDSEERTFEVFYNDGTLKNDEWYSPITMDLDSMEPEEVHPLIFQVAEVVYSAVENSKLQDIALVKQSRLSVMPLKKNEWDIIIKMSN